MSIYNFAQIVQEQERIISSAMEEQNAGNKQVFESVKSINEATELVNSGSVEMSGNGKEIKNITSKFNTFSEKIARDVQKVKSLSEKITKNVEFSRKSSNETFDNLQILSSELGTYKLA